MPKHASGWKPAAAESDVGALTIGLDAVLSAAQDDTQAAVDALQQKLDALLAKLRAVGIIEA